MPRNVLVPMDDSRPAQDALDFALSAFPEASITVLHVVDTAKYHAYGGEGSMVLAGEAGLGDGQRERAAALLDEASASAAADAREIQTATEEGHPASEIVTYAEGAGVDHIVIGSHGRTGVKRLLLGSVAEAVVRRSPVPVTVVRAR